MDRFMEALLIIGLVFIAGYALKINQEAIASMNQMNQQLQVMFVKS